MKYFKNLILALFFCASPAFAAPPSDASIKQLLTISEAHKTVDAILAQMENRMNQFAQQAVRGGKITPDQQKTLNKMNGKIAALLKDELNWNKMEPFYIKLYKDTFTQEEVNGIINFYKTPAGQAVLKKMPVLVQNSLVETQNRLRAIAPKIQQIQQEFAAEIKAQQEKEQGKAK